MWLCLFCVALLTASETISRQAKITRVKDGDTVSVEIEMGLDVVKRDVVRLAGISVKDKTEADKLATDFLKATILGKTVRMDTEKDKREKYGRLLGTIWLGTTNINAMLIERGWGKPWDGKGEAP